MAVNVIGFVYSGFQAYDVAYQLTSGKQKLRSHLRFYLDFILDQVILLLNFLDWGTSVRYSYIQGCLNRTRSTDRPIKPETAKIWIQKVALNQLDQKLTS